MIRSMKKVILYAAKPRYGFIAILVLFGSVAHAAVIGLNVSPTTRNVAIGQTTATTVTWTVVNSPTVPAATSTVVATAAFIPTCTTTPAYVLATPTNSSLTNTISTSGSSTVVHSISESVIVSADIIQRARNNGLSTISYYRRFIVPPSIEAVDPGRFACVTLNITGSGGASFAITREALSFDDGTSIRILPRGLKLQAQAELNYSGTGLMQAMWEIAEPPSTSGEPLYRPLAQVNQSLLLGDSKVIKTPVLPTDSMGLYLVRLRIIDPLADYDTPVIRYFVGDGRPGKDLPASPMTLVGPAPMALLLADTGFTWQPITTARAYQLEIYQTGRAIDIVLPDIGAAGNTPSTSDVLQALARPPATGMLVPGKQTSTVLSASARVHLKPGREYLWRVLAIGADGSVIGQSPMRVLRMP